MKAIFLISSLLFLTVTASGQHHEDLKPDTAVNNITINDYKSTELVLGKNSWSKQFEQAGSLPRIEVVNKTGTQILRLFFHYGGSKNSVDEFEMINIDSAYKIPKQVVHLKDGQFITSNKIYLGITKEDLVKKLGNSYKSSINGNVERLVYTADSKSNFVRRYNQHGYYIRCVFKDDILIKYSFGFESL
ncbi:hypothetical protein SAMN04488505_11036 [Chitinophaga rupis]|uniref:Beta-lactamase-inhibitor-like, PepSY-like n=1 Tax=Chitinophaga rupis TaxID=573321 RepID=A0A1H8G6T0_9BACT|nr:hypothetical protein [Chitinophaga rupis]SEN38988.1 hypothetical protein SAMN04488505_11036 [Chitinophaga rupis]